MGGDADWIAVHLVDPDALAATMVWNCIMLILVGTVKIADRVVREMMGL